MLGARGSWKSKLKWRLNEAGSKLPPLILGIAVTTLGSAGLAHAANVEPDARLRLRVADAAMTWSEASSELSDVAMPGLGATTPCESKPAELESPTPLAPVFAPSSNSQAPRVLCPPVFQLGSDGAPDAALDGAWAWTRDRWPWLAGPLPLLFLGGGGGGGAAGGEGLQSPNLLPAVGSAGNPVGSPGEREPGDPDGPPPVTPVPEPDAALLFALGGGIFLWARRRVAPRRS